LSDSRNSTRAGGVPPATVSRLPLYLRALGDFKAQGKQEVTSEELADAVKVTSAQLRKDLSYLGGLGTRGSGYKTEDLVATISSTLGVNREWPIVIVGCGNLGLALASYEGFSKRGFRLAALFDTAPDIVGTKVPAPDGEQITIKDISDLSSYVRMNNIQIAVITTPASSAQQVCDQLVNAGVYSIMTFAPCTLKVPSGVDVRQMDLASELQILTFHEQTKANEVISI
jgi:redox-sensing transcriptional repressor